MATPNLTEDEIDDLLYYARTNALTDLKDLLASLSPRGSPPTILTHATDAATGNSALHMSAANGHSDSTSYILSQAPSLANRPNRSGSTPLHYASLNGHVEMVKLLVETGAADAGLRSGVGRTALEEAENAGHAEVGEWLAGRMKGSEDVRGGGAAEGGVGGEAEEEEEDEGAESEGAMEVVHGTVDEDEKAAEKDGGGVKEVGDGLRDLQVDEEEK